MSRTGMHAPRSWSIWLACAAAMLLAGCGHSPPAAALPERETWDIVRIKGSRVGYVQTTIWHKFDGGRPVVEVQQSYHLGVRRFGETTEQGMRLSDVLTPEGTLLAFECEIRLGGEPPAPRARSTATR